jgi:hypothetical protein
MAQLTPQLDRPSVPDPEIRAPSLVSPQLTPAPRVQERVDSAPPRHSFRWLYGGLLFSLMLVALALALAPMARGTTYKWVDENGVVHYTDKMPAEAVDKGRVELNKQGVAVRKLDPAPSIEQRRAVQLEAERIKETARDREVAERRNRALLQSYTTEDEIDLARNRAVSTIDTQVQSSQAYSAQLARRRSEVESRKATLGNKPVPPALERELESIDSELAKQEVFLNGKKQEMAVVIARYDADKQRWRELRTVADANAAAASGMVPTPPANARPKQGTTARN